MRILSREVGWNLAVWVLLNPGTMILQGVLYKYCNVHWTQYQGSPKTTLKNILRCKAQCFSKTLQLVNPGKCLFSYSLVHYCITTVSLAFLSFWLGLNRCGDSGALHGNQLALGLDRCCSASLGEREDEHGPGYSAVGCFCARKDEGHGPNKWAMNKNPDVV